MRPFRRLWLALAGVGLAVALLLIVAHSTSFAASINNAPSISPAILFAQGTTTPTLGSPSPLPPNFQSISNETCLSCHSNPNLTMKLDDGELLSLYVSLDLYDHSIHGEKGYGCVQCHTTVGNYPHPAFSAKDRRDVSLKLYPLCQRCHNSQFQLTKDSIHAAAQASGNRNAAVCTDCHTAHAVRQLTDPQTGKLLPETRIWIPQTCAQCHYAIYQQYSTSVHGAALLTEGNPDVPTCIDCHGVHNIVNPTTAAFRLKSPQICAKCHTDPKIMDKYGIPTQVLNTYVADFHGTTATIFEKESPDARTNVAVCYDCHGVHDIQSVTNPKTGLSIKKNLLARCQVCHPDATANFPTAWLNHYIPSPEKYALIYYVNLFYKFFIPGVLGGMAILVLLDVSSIVRKRTSFLSWLMLKLKSITQLKPTSADTQTNEPEPEATTSTMPTESPPPPAPGSPPEELKQGPEEKAPNQEASAPEEPPETKREASDAGEEEDRD
jgi:quinolinate synthase